MYVQALLRLVENKVRYSKNADQKDLLFSDIESMFLHAGVIGASQSKWSVALLKFFSKLLFG